MEWWNQGAECWRSGKLIPTHLFCAYIFEPFNSELFNSDHQGRLETEAWPENEAQLHQQVLITMQHVRLSFPFIILYQYELFATKYLDDEHNDSREAGAVIHGLTTIWRGFYSILQGLPIMDGVTRERIFP